MTRHLLSLSLALSLAACSNDFDDKGDDPEGDEDEDSDDGDTDGGTDDDTDAGTDDDTDDEGDIYSDDDGDGYTEDEGDCDDGDPEVNPMAPELCNGIDDDCNGDIDDDPEDGTTYYRDADGDGYGTNAETIEACDEPGGYASNDADCNDGAATANPEGVEVDWNGIDEDCDGYDVDADACVETAINATAAYMTDGLWAVDPYEGTYNETITGFGLPVADWTIANQYLGLTETLTAKAPTEDGFALDFRVDVVMNDSSYTGNYFYSGSTFYYEGPFWLDVELNPIYSYLGLEYDTICDAWVDPIPQAFTGEVTFVVNGATQTVTGDAQLAVSLTPITAADVNYQNPTDGGGVCQWNIIDTVVQQLGYGDPSAILDESFATTLTALETTYETQLESNIALYCSAE